MVKIGEEVIKTDGSIVSFDLNETINIPDEEIRQILEVFQEGTAIIKQGKPQETTETTLTLYTKPDFILKFFTKGARYVMKTLDFPAEWSLDTKMNFTDVITQFEAFGGMLDLKDSRVYDAILFLDGIGYTSSPASTILDGVERTVVFEG